MKGYQWQTIPIIPNKESITLANELINAFEKASSMPIWLKTTVENSQATLFKLSLKLQYQGRSHTPQQNGKIERRWQTYVMSYLKRKIGHSKYRKRI